MSKLLALAAAFTLAFSLAACGKQKPAATTPPPAPPAEEKAVDEAPSEDEAAPSEPASAAPSPAPPGANPCGN